MPLTRAMRVALSDASNNSPSTKDVLSTKQSVQDAHTVIDVPVMKTLGGAQRVVQNAVDQENESTVTTSSSGKLGAPLRTSLSEPPMEDAVDVDASPVDSGLEHINPPTPVQEVDPVARKQAQLEAARERLLNIKSGSRPAGPARGGQTSSLLSWGTDDSNGRWERSNMVGSHINTNSSTAVNQPTDSDPTVPSRHAFNGSNGASSCLSWGATAPEVSAKVVGKRSRGSATSSWGSQSLGDVMSTCSKKTSSHLNREDVGASVSIEDDGAVVKKKKQLEEEKEPVHTNTVPAAGWGGSLDDVLSTAVKKTSSFAIGVGSAVDTQISKEQKDSEEIVVQEEDKKEAVQVDDMTAEDDTVQRATATATATESTAPAAPAAAAAAPSSRPMSRKERIAAEQAAIWGGVSLDAALVKPTPRVHTDNGTPGKARMSRVERARLEALQAFGGSSLGDTMSAAKLDTRDYGNHAKKGDGEKKEVQE